MASDVTQSILDALTQVIPSGRKAIGLHEPQFAGNEWKYVKECLDTGWVSSVGSYVSLFEEQLAQITGIPFAVATVNGTAALHICLKLVGVQRGDEVLLPTLTFVATANAVHYCDAIPHFVDSEENTLGLDPQKLAAYLEKIGEVRDDGTYNRGTGRRIRAVIPMHTFGHPMDIQGLADLCRKYRIELIEDAAESLGSYAHGLHTGHWGKVSALSFNGNKVVTTGGGGAILTHDPKLAELAKHLTTTAKVPHSWEFQHDQVGYNYRLPNLNAALGCAQLEQLSRFLCQKRALAQKYSELFKNVKGLKFFTEPNDCQSNYWLNAIILDEKNAGLRDSILRATHDAGILARPCWNLMHHLPMHQDSPRMDLSVAESLEKRIINLPSSAHLGAHWAASP